MGKREMESMHKSYPFPPSQDYLLGGVAVRLEGADLTGLPAHWLPPQPDLSAAAAVLQYAAEVTTHTCPFPSAIKCIYHVHICSF